MTCMKILAILVLAAAEASAAGDVQPAHSSLPGPAIPDGWGVCVHFVNPPAGELEMISAAGFRWVRTNFHWGAIERVAGRYDFSAYDKEIQTLHVHGLRAVVMLGLGNKLYEPQGGVRGEAGRQAYARWAAAAAAQFKGRGIIWEIWNEPNIRQFWGPKPDAQQYADMALAACKAIRGADPDATIIGPACSQIDLPFLEGCFKAGLLNWWDAVSVHPYPQHDPESMLDRYLKLRRLIAQYAPANKTVPIVVTEWGYSDVWGRYSVGGQGQENQAKMLARGLPYLMANQMPLLMWYDFREDGPPASRDEQAHFGMVTNAYHADRAPVYDLKPAYRAAQTFTTVLNGYHFVKRLATAHATDFALLFQHGDQVCLIVWTLAPEPRVAQPHPLAFPTSPGTFELISHTGEQRKAVTVKGGEFTVTVTDAPQYLLFKRPNPVLAGAAATDDLAPGTWTGTGLWK
jgi:hypothetical protein